MLIRLAALGALGFAAYKYLKSGDAPERKEPDASEVRVAGGPLSDEAVLQSNADAPAATTGA